MKSGKSLLHPREERFKGAHALGWLLMTVAAVLVIGAVISHMTEKKEG